MAKSYSEKLKDPRWQKKRLEIFERDNWACFDCGDETATLHVHHLEYIKEKNPWDYNNEFLITLCENCHKTETEKNILHKYIQKTIRKTINDEKLKFKWDLRIKNQRLDFFWNFMAYLLGNVNKETSGVSEFNIGIYSSYIFTVIFDFLNLEVKTKRRKKKQPERVA